MKIKIKTLQFQRNGVSGEPFYHLFFSGRGDGEQIKNGLATFNVLEIEEPNEGYRNKVEYNTCRVVDLDNPALSWRGDNLAYDINNALLEACNKAGIPNHYYDLTISAKEHAKSMKAQGKDEYGKPLKETSKSL